MRIKQVIVPMVLILLFDKCCVIITFYFTDIIEDQQNGLKECDVNGHKDVDGIH